MALALAELELVKKQGKLLSTVLKLWIIVLLSVLPSCIGHPQSPSVDVHNLVALLNLPSHLLQNIPLQNCNQGGRRHERFASTGQKPPNGID